MKNKDIARELLKMAKNIISSIKLRQIYGDDMTDAYIDIFHGGEPFSDSDRKQFSDVWEKRLERIIRALQSDDIDAFRKEVSLNKNIYLGKLTFILMKLTGMRRVRNLSELFEKMKEVV